MLGNYIQIECVIDFFYNFFDSDQEKCSIT